MTRRTQWSVGLTALLAPGMLAAQTKATLGLAASLVEQRVDIGGGVQRTFGPVVSVYGTRPVRAWLELQGHVSSGTLHARTAGAESRDVGEVEVAGRAVVGSTVAVIAGLRTRTFSGPLAVQRWTSLSLGAEGRLLFVGGAIRGVVRGAVLPLVSVTGLARPNLAVAAASGLEWTGSRLSGAAFYHLERYDFPDQGTGRRREQVAAFTVQVGLRLGRRM